MARAPRFQRTEQPTARGTGLINVDPTQPYARQTQDPFNRSLMDLGKRLNAYGTQMVNRSSAIKLEELTLQFNKESAEFEANLDPDDYAIWTKQVEDFNKSQDSAYAKIVKDAGYSLTKDDKARFLVRAKKDSQRSRLQVLRQAKITEKRIIPIQLGRMIDNVAKDLAPEGFRGMKTRAAVQNAMSAIEEQRDILGSVGVTELKNGLLEKIELEHAYYRINSNPDSIVDAGGIEQFTHLDARAANTIINQAKTQVGHKKSNYIKGSKSFVSSLNEQAGSLETVIGLSDYTDPDDFAVIQGQLSSFAKNIQQLEERIISSPYPQPEIEKDLKDLKQVYTASAVAIDFHKQIVNADSKTAADKIVENFTDTIIQANTNNKPNLVIALGSHLKGIRTASKDVKEKMDLSITLEGLQNRTVDINDSSAKKAIQSQMDIKVPVQIQEQLRIPEKNRSPDKTLGQLISENFFQTDEQTGEREIGVGAAFLVNRAEKYGVIPPNELNVLKSIILNPSTERDDDLDRGMAIEILSNLNKNNNFDLGLKPESESELKTLIDLFDNSHAKGEYPAAFGRLGRIQVLGIDDQAAFDASQNSDLRTLRLIQSLSEADRMAIFAEATASMTEKFFADVAESVTLLTSGVPFYQETIDLDKEEFEQMSNFLDIVTVRLAETTTLDNESIIKIATSRVKDVFGLTSFGQPGLTMSSRGTAIGQNQPDHEKFSDWYGGSSVLARQEIARDILTIISKKENALLAEDPNLDLVRRIKPSILFNRTENLFDKDGRFINNEKNQENLDIGDDVATNFIGYDNKGNPQWHIFIKGEPLIDYSQGIETSPNIRKGLPYIYTPNNPKGAVGRQAEIDKLMFKRKFTVPIRDAVSSTRDAVGNVIEQVTQTDVVANIDDVLTGMQKKVKTGLTPISQSVSDNLLKIITQQANRGVNTDIIPVVEEGED